ncbi:MAG: OmpA family protein [Alphaproteobacteria bacterium]|nr:OmpA family protein [Alphaproteobacteria bacterium]MBU2085261.1 OmpA family protein [Alphaproteobacteria bacterium]MBU2143402.1 OmpA family protein [Alphaproteobacteria bacterium]
MATFSLLQKRTVSRRVRFRSSRRVPFMPYGFVPAFGLLVLLWIGMGPFAKYVIEQSVIRATEHVIATNDAGWARAAVSGQQVWLEGQPPTQMEGEQLVALVRAARMPALFGEERPVTRVRARYGPAITSPTATRKPEWTFRVSGGVMRLEGTVPDEVTRSSLAAAAEGLVDARNITQVDDFLTVTHVAEDTAYTQVALKGITAVGQCDQGVATFLNQEFSLRCELPNTGVTALQQLIAQPLPIGRLGNVDILSNEAVATCDSSLADLLGGTHIEFALASAEIDPSSNGLLQSVADAAATCPGTLRIEGHTDSMGSANANELLGDARAEAVREALIARGIPADRLIAEGFGARRPIGDNTTAEGRAHNRRIEIRVVRASD